MYIFGIEFSSKLERWRIWPMHHWGVWQRRLAHIEDGGILTECELQANELPLGEPSICYGLCQWTPSFALTFDQFISLWWKHLARRGNLKAVQAVDEMYAVVDMCTKYMSLFLWMWNADENGTLVVSGGVVGMDFTQSLDSKTVSALYVLVSECSVVRTFARNREVVS